VPHIAEELWEAIGEERFVSNRPWPVYSEALARSEKIQIVVQINGKVRSKIIMEAGVTEDEVRDAVLSDQKVREYVSDKEIRKWVYVPHKLVSIVV
jgi:leucyl-tRNA synthetase